MKGKNNDITLAIFPFENLSDGKTNDFYCKSLYMDLVTELSRFRQFSIIAKQSLPSGISSDSVNFYKPLDYVIRGSFRTIGKGIRINAQLLRPESNQVVWADNFEGNKESVQVIQQTLLEQIAASLQQQLNYDLLGHIRKGARTDTSAYECWLYGMEELKSGTIETDEKARQYFSRAIEIDPDYSLACSGMSMTYFNEWSCQLWERWDISRSGAFQWAKKAIELDGQNYIASFVLGRVYLYEADYDLSEYYFRRALRLNPNDVDCLIQVGSGLVFLGYAQEAEHLYQRVLYLNPINADNYQHIGAFIALECGDFKKAIEAGRHTVAPWLDFDAFLAAAYYHAGDQSNMHASWDRFICKFEERIVNRRIEGIAEVVTWLQNVNPYKGESYFYTFLKNIGGNLPALPAEEMADVASVTRPANRLVKRNGFWEIKYQHSVSFVVEVKGLSDLAKLLGSREKEFHCTELMGSAVYAEAEPVFDEKAKKAYRKKLQELKEEIDELDERTDHEGKAALQLEYDSLLKHLMSSLGLGGKRRKTNDPVDKIRSAVTWRIRKAIRMIEKENASLARHLDHSIKTGVFCSYKPESPMTWEVDG